MFIVHFKDGTTLNERQCEFWDNVPTDKEITSLQLTLPFEIKRMEGDNEIERHTPLVTISNYDKYYCAKEAVALIMTLNERAEGQVEGGGQKGTVVKEVMAGIDEKRGFVFYVEVDRKANVTFKRFPLKDFKVQPQTLRKGSY